MAIEDVSGMILDVAGVTADQPLSKLTGYFHCVNPNTTSWGALVPTIQAFYGDKVKLSSLEGWYSALEAKAGDARNVTKIPGIKLLDTYRGMLEGLQRGVPHVDLDVARAVDASPTMRELKAISPELMKHWCAQWEF